MQPARTSAAALQLPTAAYSCNPYGESLVQPARTCGVALQLQSPAESVQCCCECSRRLTGAGAQSAATGTASVWENQRRVAVLGIGVQTHHAAPGPFEFDWNGMFSFAVLGIMTASSGLLQAGASGRGRSASSRVCPVRHLPNANPLTMASRPNIAVCSTFLSSSSDDRPRPLPPPFRCLNTYLIHPPPPPLTFFNRSSSSSFPEFNPCSIHQATRNPGRTRRGRRRSPARTTTACCLATPAGWPGAPGPRPAAAMGGGTGCTGEI